MPRAGKNEAKCILRQTNARIAATIKKGVKGEMPTFAKKYDDKQIASLVSYLRTLR